MKKQEKEEHKTTSAGSDAFWVNLQPAGSSVVTKHSVGYRSCNLSKEAGSGLIFYNQYVMSLCSVCIVSFSSLEGYFTMFQEAFSSALN